MRKFFIGAFEFSFPFLGNPFLGLFSGIWSFQYTLALLNQQQTQSTAQAPTPQIPATQVHMPATPAPDAHDKEEPHTPEVASHKPNPDMMAQDMKTPATASSDAMMAGFRAEYFVLPGAVSSLDQVDFQAESDHEEMVDSISFARTRKAFWEGGPRNEFAARYSGELKIEKGGSYEFRLKSDDLSALYIDGVRIINIQSGRNQVDKASHTITLAEGQHSIEIHYAEERGIQRIKLEWSGPDTDNKFQMLDSSSVSQHSCDHHDHETPDTDMTGTDHDHTDHTDGHEETTSGHGEEHTDETGTDAHEDHSDNSDGDTDAHDQSHNYENSTAIPLPTSPDEVEAYVAAVKAQADHSGHMAHADDEQKATEHGQLLDLVPHAEATHIAIAHGDWFDPNTWYNGEIPGDGAKVLIPEGVSVRYNGKSDASLFTVRVDGELSFATDMDSSMKLDTMVVSPAGRLEIGTAENPIEDGVNVEIIIANNGDIDTNWDPTLLSRGIISHGEAEIHGAEKTGHLSVAETAMAGDTTLKLSEIPDNWQVGDTIVLTGTHQQGWFYNHAIKDRDFAESEDEELTITAIDGDTITLDRPLQFDHDTPRDDLSAYVANTSRNVTIRSEDGEASEVHHRGHVMFMHSNEVDVRYAAFDDLGRTDKSKPAFHGSSLDPADIEADTNVQGRYSLHLHRTGTEDQDDPAIAMGNAVNGSPGWGYVHHSSHADLIDNIAFDVFGAAFVAEDGDETGTWWRNMAIKTEGIGYGHAKTKSGDDVNRDDVGRTGDGFFFAGRLVEASENIAANTTHGYVWMTRATTRPGEVMQPDANHTDQPDSYYGAATPKHNDYIPLHGFSDNIAFGTRVGLIVVKRGGQQNHEVRSVLDGFVNWETTEGVQLTYAAHYTLKDFDLIGTYSTKTHAWADTGFEFGPLVFDVAVNGLTVANFKTGVDLDQRARDYWTDSDFGHILIDVDASDNEVAIEGFDPDRHQILSSEDLVVGRLGFEMEGDTKLSFYENMFFDGIKTDSVGSRDRQFIADEQDIKFIKNIIPILQRDGYYQTEDGTYVALIPDFIADRATGELLKFAHVIELDFEITKLDRFDVAFNGLIDLESQAPVTEDDHAQIDSDMAILLNVLNNDVDPDGDLLEIGGFTNPFKGNLKLHENGEFEYSPFDGFVGTDTFDYWARDPNGQYTRGTVTIDVVEHQIFDM